MYELWTTIVAPVLDAARPGLVLDVAGGDERLAQLAASFMEPWGGRVQSWSWQSGEAPPSGVEVVLLHRDQQTWAVREPLDRLVGSGGQAGLQLPVILVHG